MTKKKTKKTPPRAMSRFVINWDGKTFYVYGSNRGEAYRHFRNAYPNAKGFSLHVDKAPWKTSLYEGPQFFAKI